MKQVKTLTCNLRNKRKPTRSCRVCARKAANSGWFQKKHGLSRAPEYRSRASMIYRCGNPKHEHYADYGGRGIKVCERWIFFKNFYEDMAPRPQGMSLDRKNNDLGYFPGNLRLGYAGAASKQ
jgi:hypothetical protein